MNKSDRIAELEMQLLEANRKIERYEAEEDPELKEYFDSQDVPHHQLAGEMFDDKLEMYRNEY